MNLRRRIAVGAFSLALAATGVTTLGATAAQASAPGITSDQQAALLSLLDAPTVKDARAVVTSDAIPEGVSSSVTDALQPLAATTPLGTEEPAVEGADNSEVALNALRRAIDPSLYQCEPTELDTYVDQNLFGPWYGFDVTTATPEELKAWGEGMGPVIALALVGGFDAPSYDLLLHADDARFSRYGRAPVNETANLQRTFFALKNFWDVNGRAIRFEPLKSTIYFSGKASDVPRVGKGALASIAPDKIPAQDNADAVKLYTAFGQGLMDTAAKDPWINDPDQPIFTLNAFAMDPGDENPIFGTFGKILAYGDGLLAAQSDLGLLDVGPEAVMGHEYGHHVQYINKAFTTEVSPEATRRTELMADAYGSYFAAHSEGLALKNRQLSHVVSMFEQVGDCGFDSLGHHGTPLQRQEAAEWGVGLAQDALCQVPTKPGRTCHAGYAVIGSKKLQRQFDQVLPTLVLPDA